MSNRDDTKPKPWEITRALIQRGEIAQAAGGTLADYVEAVEHPLKGVRGDDLTAVIAYLTAQVVGLQLRADADETLALAKIDHIIRDLHEAQGRAKRAEGVPA